LGKWRILLKLDDLTTKADKVIQLATNAGQAKLTADSATAPAGGATAGALLGGDVALFVDDQSGQFSAHEWPGSRMPSPRSIVSWGCTA